MAETTYVSVVWTAGDIITEAKMDNMVANDRAVDSMYQGIRFTERAAPTTPPANTLHIYAKDKSGISSLYMIDDSGTEIQLGDVTPIFTFPLAGPLYVAANIPSALIIPKALQIIKVYAYVKTAPIGASIICDILKNSSSIWNSTPANRISIADGANAGSEAAFDITTLAEGDILTLDIIQVGSGTSGSDLTIEIKTK